jgi:ubiquinone biosynthesis protein
MIPSASPNNERPFSHPTPMTDKRQKQIQNAVAEGVTAWQTRHEQNPVHTWFAGSDVLSGANGRGFSANGRTIPPESQPPDDFLYDSSPGQYLNLRSINPDQPGIMASLPRRRFLTAQAAETPPPKMRFITFQASYTRAFGRFFVWLGILLSFAAGAVWDWLLRRGSPERRAVRLRHLFEKAGNTFIKVGQHLALRIDFLPWVYCVELSRMVDKAPPFPVEQAIERVEKATGRPLADTFRQFDPKPIGSTAVACVYQALLKNGEKVVVKVRRPGIGQLFMADFLVFDFLANALEFFTILRPGHTANMRRELRETLLEELDFIQEARFQDSFRRAAKKSGKKFFTSTRVFFDLCDEDVIVEEFANGMWLWELLAAVESNDEETLTLADELNIDPGKVARRLQWVNFWGWHEHLFFHADPNPENIIVGPNSTLTYIDFGSIGAVDRSKRQALQQNMYYAWKEDPLNMARASLILLEPLPPIDLIDFTKELETHNWQMLYALAVGRSTRQLHERTSATQWLGLLQEARKYGVTVDFHILRLLRAILLCDTMSLQLDNELDIIAEYRRFSKNMSRRIGRRVRRRAARQLTEGIDDKIYLRVERWVNAGEGLFFNLRHMLAIPSVNFSALMSKWSFAIFMVIVFVAQALVVTGIGVTAVAVGHYLAGTEITAVRPLLEQLVTNRFYLVIILILFIINSRSLLFRLDDKEI